MKNHRHLTKQLFINKESLRAQPKLQKFKEQHLSVSHSLIQSQHPDSLHCPIIHLFLQIHIHQRKTLDLLSYSIKSKPIDQIQWDAGKTTCGSNGKVSGSTLLTHPLTHPINTRHPLNQSGVGFSSVNSIKSASGDVGRVH